MRKRLVFFLLVKNFSDFGFLFEPFRFVFYAQGNRKASGPNSADIKEALMEELRKEAMQDAFLERAQKVHFFPSSPAPETFFFSFLNHSCSIWFINRTFSESKKIFYWTEKFEKKFQFPWVFSSFFFIILLIFKTNFHFSSAFLRRSTRKALKLTFPPSRMPWWKSCSKRPRRTLRSSIRQRRWLLQFFLYSSHVLVCSVS